MIGVHSQIVTLLFFFNFTAYYIVRGLDLQAILMFMNNVVTYVFYFTHFCGSFRSKQTYSMH